MSNSLVLIHTVPPLLDVFAQLFAEFLPEIDPLHVLDEPLLEQVRLHGSLSVEDIAQLQMHVDTAERIGARAVLVTCSTLSPGVDRVHAGIRVFKVDEAMVEQAVKMGTEIGIVATNQTTLGATQQLLLEQSARIGKKIEINKTLVQDALQALLKGDGVMHDQLVKESILNLAEKVDVIVLAQASTARVLKIIPESMRRVPILASPYMAIKRVRQWWTKQSESDTYSRRP